MASYESAPSYQTYQVNPYQAPTSQIVQAIGARQNAWDIQASRLKDTYQNYLNLDLGLEANQQKLDGYMQTVNEGLKQATKTDLSLSQNTDDAMKVFDPIVKDEGIKYDNAYTKQVKEQVATAQALRTVNGGKEYSDTNLGYMTKPYQEFVKANDPSQARMAYANRRYYTPYTDVTAEQKDLYKNFKPDVTKFKHPDTEEYVDPKDGKTKTRLTDSGYMITQENKNVMASQYRAYLNANLSDKAKQQLHINGVMSYGDNIQALAGDYVDHNNSQIDSYNKSYDDVVGKAKATKDLNLQSQYETQAKDFSNKIAELKASNNKIKTGDLSEVQKNKESIAGSIYTSSYIDQLANASKRLDMTTSYDPDMTSLTKFKERLTLLGKREEIQSREKIAEEEIKGRMEVEQWKTSHTKGANGEEYDLNGNIIVATSPNTQLATQLNNENFGATELNKMKDDADSLRNSSFDFLNDQLSNVIKVNGKPLFTSDMNVDQKKAAAETWANEKNDKGEYINRGYVYNEFQRQQRLADIKEANYNAINDTIDKDVQSKSGDINKQRIDLVNGITSGQTSLMFNQNTKKYENVSLTKEELQSIAKGNNPNMRIGNGNKWEKTFNPGSVSGTGYDEGTTGDKINILTYKGNKYEIIPGEGAFQQIGNIENPKTRYTKPLTQIAEVNSDLDSKTQTIRNQAINKAMTRMKGVEDFQNPDAKYLEPVRAKITNSIGVPGVDMKDIKLVSRDNAGGLYFRIIPNNQMGIDGFVGAKEKAKELYGTNSYIKQADEFYIPPDKVGSDVLKPRTYTMPGMDDIKTMIEFKNSDRPDNKSFSTPPFKIGNEDFQIISNKIGGQPTYTLMHSKSGAVFTQLNDTPFLNIEEATLQAKKLVDLKTADPVQFIKMIKTKGGQPNYTGQ